MWVFVDYDGLIGSFVCAYDERLGGAATTTMITTVLWFLLFLRLFFSILQM